MKERDDLLNHLGLRETILVHNDISQANVRDRTSLNRFLFGPTGAKASNGHVKPYHYPGLLELGAEWVGQSVFLLKPDLADRLITVRRKLGIRHWVRTIYVSA